METSVEVDEAPDSMLMARLVEACECPLGYAGLSCQVNDLPMMLNSLI